MPAFRPRCEPLEPREVPTAGVLTGFAAIGDSYTIERGGNNWPSQLGAIRGINFGPAVSVPAASGAWLDYAYVVDGTPLTMAANGTLASTAARVADGSVTLVYLDGVGRDYAARYAAIYQGALAGSALAAFTDGVVASVRAAIDTLRAAGEVKLVLESVADFSLTPFIQVAGPSFLGGPLDPAKLQRYPAAAAAVNARLQALADEYRLPLVDQSALADRIAGPGRQVVVGGHPLDYSAPPLVTSTVVTDPLDLWIDYQHVGPVFQGLKANVVLDAIHEAYEASVPRLSDQEILAYAYGRAGQTPPAFPATTYFPRTGLVNFNRAPTATADAVVTRQNAAVTFAPLGNDTDPNGDPLRVAGVSAAAHGTVTVNPDGTLTYTPSATFPGGTDTFTYTITDGRFRTATATVTVTVVQNVSINVRPDSVNLTAQGVLPVTLFSSAEFDATRADLGSIRLAGAAVAHAAVEDVNGDGRPDLVLHFRLADTNLRQVYAALLADDADADGVLDSTRQTATVSLTGRTTAGVSFAGEDTVGLFLSGRALRELLDQLAAAGAI